MPLLGVEESEFLGTPARFLKLSKEIPIDLDETNRQAMIQDQKEEFQHNADVQYEKTLPWQKLLGLTFGVLLFFGLKNLPKFKEKSIENTIKTAKAKSLIQLNALQMDKLSKRELYQKLSDILRNFIEERYGISAPAQTTEEFLQALEDKPLSESFPKEALSRFLQESDLVKFAKHLPEKGATSNAYMLVQTFIET